MLRARRGCARAAPRGATLTWRTSPAATPARPAFSAQAAPRAARLARRVPTRRSQRAGPARLAPQAGHRGSCRQARPLRAQCAPRAPLQTAAARSAPHAPRVGALMEWKGPLPALFAARAPFPARRGLTVAGAATRAGSRREMVPSCARPAARAHIRMTAARCSVKSAARGATLGRGVPSLKPAASNAQRAHFPPRRWR